MFGERAPKDWKDRHFLERAWIDLKLIFAKYNRQTHGILPVLLMLMAATLIINLIFLWQFIQAAEQVGQTIMPSCMKGCVYPV
jgi:hypothetical protein